MVKWLFFLLGGVLSEWFFQTKISVFWPHHQAQNKCLGFGFYRGFRDRECKNLEDFLSLKPFVLMPDSPFFNFKLKSLDQVTLTGIGRFYFFGAKEKEKFGKFRDDFEDSEDPNELRCVSDEEGSLTQALLSFKNSSALVFPDGSWRLDLSKQRRIEINVLPQFAARNVICLTVTGGDDFFSLSSVYYDDQAKKKIGLFINSQTKLSIRASERFHISTEVFDIENSTRNKSPPSPLYFFEPSLQSSSDSEASQSKERIFFVQLENFRWRIFLKTIRRKCIPINRTILEVDFHDDFGFEIK